MTQLPKCYIIATIVAFSSIAVAMKINKPEPSDCRVIGAHQRLLDTFEQETVEKYRQLPNMSTFEAYWNALAGCYSRTFNNTPLSHGRLLYGVFSVFDASAFEQIIKNTWMKESGICPLGDGPLQRCSVYVAFVVGRQGCLNEERLRDPYTMMLDVEENMNRGKTYSFFYHVSRTYPWVTHIVKGDLDFYPFAYKLLNYAHKNAYPNDYEYFGLTGGTPGVYIDDENSTCPKRENFVRFAHESQFFFTTYGLSRNMALEATEEGGAWAKHAMGPEDHTPPIGILWWRNKTGKCAYMFKGPLKGGIDGGCMGFHEPWKIVAPKTPLSRFSEFVCPPMPLDPRCMQGGNV